MSCEKIVVSPVKAGQTGSNLFGWYGSGIISFGNRLFKGIIRFMGQRREARERAVQFLFQHDLNPPENLEEALEAGFSSGVAEGDVIGRIRARHGLSAEES